MIIIKKGMLLALVFVVGGCTAISTAPHPDSYYIESAYTQRDAESDEPLFASDGEGFSEEMIRRIFAHPYKPQPQNRIAILTSGQAYWFGWSDELARAGAEVQLNLVKTLRASPLVYDASYLPSLLVPEKKTVGRYREAAARYQADLLLIYRSTCQSYEKYRFLSADKTKSYCSIEAVLLDTRTGIVPFTTLVSQNFSAQKNETDLNFDETIRRVELTAMRDALTVVAQEIVTFLAKSRQ